MEIIDIWKKLEEDYHMYGKAALDNKLLYEAILNLNMRLTKLEKKENVEKENVEKKNEHKL